MATTMILVTTDKDGNVVNDGDTVTSFRGEPAVFQYASRAAVPGKSGKVVVRWANAPKPDDGFSGRAEYYDKVFGLSVSGLLSCGCPHALPGLQRRPSGRMFRVTTVDGHGQPWLSAVSARRSGRRKGSVMLISEAMERGGVQEHDVLMVHRIAYHREPDNVSRFVFLVRDGRYCATVQVFPDDREFTVIRRPFDDVTDADRHARELCGW